VTGGRGEPSPRRGRPSDRREILSHRRAHTPQIARKGSGVDSTSIGRRVRRIESVHPTIAAMGGANMSWIVSVVLFLGLSFVTYRTAVQRGEWSWPAFAWTLGLILVYVGAIAAVVVATIAWGPDPAIATATIVAAILVGAVPLGIVAKRIQRHYLGPRV
jgi:hypothetical protein